MEQQKDSVDTLNIEAHQVQDGIADLFLLQRGMASSDCPSLPEGWNMCVHPQGWVYFHNPTLKVTTDSDMRDEEAYNSITDQCRNSTLDVKLEQGMELQLHAVSSLGHPPLSRSLNLVINHTFCVASFNALDIVHQNVPLLGPNDLNRRRRMYWNYMWHHPSHTPTPPRASRDAADALTWFYTDNLISGTCSRVPFSKTECEELSVMLRDLAQPQSDSSVSKTVFLSWLLREVCSFRDAEGYGQHTPKAAQAIAQSMREKKDNIRQPGRFILPMLNICINLLFFGIPWTYLVHIARASKFRGRLNHVQQNWEEYINRLVREYTHFLLISTVLLSATISFLALNDLSQIARVSATLSTFASLGGIIIGVFSVWKHQIKCSTADSFAYMYNARQSFLGHHGHAILLSLPPVLLVWAIVAFTFSMVAYTLQGIVDHDVYSSTSSWILVAVFIVILISVCLALHTLTFIWRIGRPTIRMFRYNRERSKENYQSRV